MTRRRSSSSHVSKPLQRTIGAAPVYVHPIDWSDVCAGQKSEIRAYGPRPGRPLADGCPRPCILYCPHPLTGEVRTRVAVLEEVAAEPAGAITPESLRREGFRDLGEFRRYIEQRYPRGGYRPLGRMRVYRFHLMSADDVDEWGRWALRRLYGDALP